MRIFEIDLDGPETQRVFHRMNQGIREDAKHQEQKRRDVQNVLEYHDRREARIDLAVSRYPTPLQKVVEPLYRMFVR